MSGWRMILETAGCILEIAVGYGGVCAVVQGNA
jgi:hypothetical protein